MTSHITGFEYKIIIGCLRKDYKHYSWGTEFVLNVSGELESSFKEEISVYLNINPHDGLLEEMVLTGPDWKPLLDQPECWEEIRNYSKS